MISVFYMIKMENGHQNLLNKYGTTEETFQIKRRKVLWLIGILFSVIALILIISVVHEEYKKDNYIVRTETF